MFNNIHSKKINNKIVVGKKSADLLYKCESIYAKTESEEAIKKISEDLALLGYDIGINGGNDWPNLAIDKIDINKPMYLRIYSYDFSQKIQETFNDKPLYVITDDPYIRQFEAFEWGLNDIVHLEGEGCIGVAVNQFKIDYNKDYKVEI